MGLKPQRLLVLTACAKPVSSAWSPAVAILPNERLHLHYGPIDVLIDVDADKSTIAAAHNAAQHSFDGLLEALVCELPLLRTPLTSNVNQRGNPPEGVVANSMWRACLPHANRFVTPMAAVAGAVADFLVQGMQQAAPKARRLMVNNGGDIALWLSPGAQSSIAVCQNNATQAATITLRSNDGVGGIATSGWTGRSYSLGIADAVTVLAPTAAAADVAATLIANAVQLSCAETDTRYVKRIPANELQPDSDLSHTQVTVAVSELPKRLREQAVQNGLNEARQLMTESTLAGVFISCQGHQACIGEWA